MNGIFDGLTKHLPAPVAAVVGLVAIGGASILGGTFLAETFESGTRGARVSSANIESIAPEGFFGSTRREHVFSDDYMMVAAHPAAAQIGAAVLDDGGSAIDALIAAQMALNLVEPQSSGIGGGGFLLYWDADDEALFTYDGRETAPAGIDASLFAGPGGDTKGFFEAVTGGKSVGVPGLLRMLEMAHEAHGEEDWSDLLDPTIALAEEGFPISPRLHGLLQDALHLKDIEPAATYFYDADGRPKPVGHVLKNPDFAETLRLIRDEGADAFYTGPLADKIVETVRNAPRNPGWLSREDLSGYEAKLRGNLCTDYHGHRVCGMGPPSSGGSTVLQILELLERTDIGDRRPDDPATIRLFAEAMRLAHADRDRYIGDTDFVSVPLEGLLSEAYLDRRAKAMDLSGRRKGKAEPGLPKSEEAAWRYGDATSPERPSTTHLVAVDRDGNIASMTSSIETGFGSRLMVGGFLLNNQLTDFSWKDSIEGRPAANALAPGKRPRSSMAPTIVFGPDGAPRLAVGSPGGSRIIGYVARTIMAVIDWEFSAQEAVELPHYLNRNGPLELENDPRLVHVLGEMKRMGYKIQIRPMASGLHAVEFAGGLMVGGVDPRREGAAVASDQLTPTLDEAFDVLLPKGEAEAKRAVEGDSDTGTPPN